MKKTIRVCAFLLVLLLLLGFTQDFLQAKWGPDTAGARETTNTVGFYHEPRNTLDVLLVGSSNVFFGTSPLKMYEEQGFTSYVRGSANQPIMLSYYTILDSLRRQSPKVIVLEVDELFRPFDPVEVEYSARRALDYMQLSRIKLAAIRDLPIDGSDQTRISYVLPLLRYHGRWKELEEADFKYFFWERRNYLKGQYPGTAIYDFRWPDGFMTPSDEAEELPADNVAYLERIDALCREKGIGLVLTSIPNAAWSYARHNAVQAEADKLGLRFLDYNLPEMLEEIDIHDWEDFTYNQWHLRVTGADKLSVHLGAFLASSYGLPDRRGEKGFEQWDTDLAAYNAMKAERIGVGASRNEAGPGEPDIPALGTFSNRDNGLFVTWSPVDGAQSYAVFRRAPSGDWVTLGYTEETGYLDETAEFGTPYLYTVKAIRDSIVSFCDPNGMLAIRIAVPELTEAAVSEEGVRLVWKAAKGAAAYHVLRREEGTEWTPLALTSDTEYCDGTTEAGTTYFYAVQGVKRGCCSDYDRDGTAVIVP